MRECENARKREARATKETGHQQCCTSYVTLYFVLEPGGRKKG
jgi:hypothetical protein